MTQLRKAGARSRISNPALAAALARLNERTRAATKQRQKRAWSLASSVAAHQKMQTPRYLDVLRTHYPALHTEWLALQEQVKNPVINSAKWREAIEAFRRRNGPALRRVQDMFPDTGQPFLSHLIIPDLRFATGHQPTSAPPTSAQPSGPKIVSLLPPDWNGVAVGDPPYKDGHNLVETDGTAGTCHISTQTRFAIDTFGLSNTAGCGVYVDVEPGYRKLDISVQYGYSGEVNNSAGPFSEASSNVDLIYDVTDVGTGDSVDHFECTLRGILVFPPSSFGQYSDFSADGDILSSSIALNTARHDHGDTYLVSIQYRCTGQAFGVAEANAYVYGDLNRVDVTLTP